MEPVLLEPRSRRRRGHRKQLAVTAAAVVLAGVTATLLVGMRAGTDTGEAPAVLPPATAAVTRQTLRETLEVDGELGYGPTLTATTRRPGTVTWLPAGDAVVSQGQPLYRVDNGPVVLLYGSVPAYRDLRDGVEGPDVAQLERDLAALGYKGFTVDDEYTASTASAVRDWQEDLGLTETGVVDLGRVVFASAAVHVETVEAETGQSAGPGQRILTYTGTTKVVTVRLDVEDRPLAKQGTVVSVALPGGKVAAGKVTEVATVIEPGAGGDAEPTTEVEALVALDDQQVAADLGAASVDVTFTASERKDVLTVPVAALVALEAGGFGIEVVEGTTTRHVAVRTGLFAGGRVEISGDGVTAGLTVGMPK